MKMTNFKTNKKTKKSDKQLLLSFLAISFGLTWSIAVLLIAFYDQIISVFGELTVFNPLFVLAVYSPGITAVFLVWRIWGRQGLQSFFKRMTLWRIPLGWLLFILVGIPAMKYLGAFMNGGAIDFWSFSPWYSVIPVLALALFLGPVEEFGWRGFALPLLQRRYNPFWASIILGVIWMVWHIPAFLIGGTLQSGWAFIPYFIGGVAISVIFTAIYNDTKGSLLIAFLLHFQLNNPIWPDAQPWENYLVAAIAIGIVLIYRKRLFDKKHGETSIVNLNLNHIR